MPWNDNANPGPWGTPPDNGGRGEPPKRPQPPRGGGPRRPDGPDFNAGFDDLKRRARDMFGGGGQNLKPGAFAALGGAAFVLWALSGLYVVQPNEAGVVTTFGAYSRSETPGLRYHLPFPIEKVEKVPVTTLNRIDIGGASDSSAQPSSMMVTRDENIVDMSFAVTWRVADPSKYLFAVREPEDAVKSVAESAMRQVVGKTLLDNVFGGAGRGQAQRETAELMQRTLDSWGSGIRVVEVQIRSVNPPQEVIAAFRDVQSATQDKESAVNEANSYRNRVVNEAKGDAAKIIQSAQGYREQAVREAVGETSRFDQIYNEYRRAPGVTKERLYIETMQRVLAKSNKVVVDSKGASAPIILPPDVFRPRATAPAAQAAPTIVTPAAPASQGAAQ